MKNLFNQLAEHQYFINLSDRTDRLETFTEMADSHGLDIERIDAVSEGFEDVENLLIGYARQNQSVINTLNDAIEKGYKSIAIWEDDVYLTDEAKDVLMATLDKSIEHKYFIDGEPIYATDEDGELTEEIIGYEQVEQTEMICDLPNDWDLLSLGCVSNYYKATHISGRIYRLSHAGLGNLWILKSNTFEPLIAELEKMELPYDECISKLIAQLHSYKAFAIMGKGIALQSVGMSDNTNQLEDHSEVS